MVGLDARRGEERDGSYCGFLFCICTLVGSAWYAAGFLSSTLVASRLRFDFLRTILVAATVDKYSDIFHCIPINLVFGLIWRVSPAP